MPIRLEQIPFGSAPPAPVLPPAPVPVTAPMPNNIFPSDPLAFPTNLQVDLNAYSQYNKSGFGSLPSQNFMDGVPAAGGGGGGLFGLPIPSIDPVTTAVNFGVGLIQNVLGHNQKVEAANLQNERIAEEYKQKLKIQQSQIIRDDNIYNFKKQAYRDRLRNLDATAQAAYAQEDLRLNELFKQAAFARQGENIQLAQSLGAAQASRSRGRSARRAEAMTMAAFGRNQAVRAEQLFTSKLASQMRRDTIQRNTASAREAAYANVAFAPVRPIAPLKPNFVQGPSGMDLFGNLLGTAGSAFGAGVEQYRANERLKTKNTLRDRPVMS